MSLLSILFIYILGGLTFIPLTLIIFIYLLPNSQTQTKQSPSETQSSSEYTLKAGEVEELNGLETYKVGWIIVTRDYIESPDDITSNLQSITESTDTKSAYSSLYKIAKDEEMNDDVDDVEVESTNTINSTNSTNTNTVKSSKKKHKFYAVLKHGNLFLYKDQTTKDVKHVIVMTNYLVSIWPRNLTDAQLFSKYSSIALLNCTNLKNVKQYSKGSFFIYCDNNYDKEDWYFALIRATKSSKSTMQYCANMNPNSKAKTLHFKTKEMIELIQTLYSSEQNLQTKWLNALIGRWFLGIKDTNYFSNYIELKFNKKLNKIKRPDFLNEFKITNIEPGKSAPFLTYPNLKEINPDGTVIVNSFISYTGEISLTIETKFDITFGTKFTNKKEVDILLKITLLKLQGPILIKFKPPPTNRIWYTYETEPVLMFKIEPLLSNKSLNYNFITNSIEKKFKEAFKESMVLPHWDDIVFFNTENQPYRGGIWEENDQEEIEQDTKENIESQDEVNDIEEQIELDSESDIPKSELKMKFSNTIKKMTTKKSSTNLDEPNSPYSAYFKKLWTPKEKQAYIPPEMISNRRPRRDTNTSTTSSLNTINTKNDDTFSIKSEPMAMKSEPTVGLRSESTIGLSSTSPMRTSTLRKPPPNMDFYE